MRKLMCSALMIGLLVLSACGGTKQQRLESFRERFAESDSLRMTARVQADCGDTVETYTLEYSYDGAEWTVLVTEPAFAAGITARIGADASELEYDGAILATGDLLENGISPIASVPLLAETLRTGTFDSMWSEEELLAGTYLYDDARSASVWFDAAGLPIAGELMENGITKVRCTFANTEIKDSNDETTDKTNMGGDQSDPFGA